MRAAALVADPAGDAYVEPEVEVRAQLLALAGEAMRHGLFGLERRNDLREAGKSIPRMEEQRFLQFQGQLDLGDEPFLLVGMRRVVAVEVEAAFTDCDD